MSRKRVLQTTAAPAAAVAANGHAKQSSSRDTNHRYPMTSCSCQLVPRCLLPGYLDDNIYLDDYHRPELGSVIECVKTLFCLHTETMNIWTHLAGEILHTCTHHLPHTWQVRYCTPAITTHSCAGKANMRVTELYAVVCEGCCGCAMLATYFMLTSQSDVTVRVLVALYFAGAIFCLGASSVFHAFNCHSEAAYRIVIK
jgi:adiponectin receptor